MERLIKIIIMLLLGAGLCPDIARAQTPEVTQLVLNIEKLNQLRKILKELKSGYEILFKGYTTIRDLSQRNFKLHEAFLDALLQVSPAVKNYKRVTDIVSCQLAIVSEYKATFRKLSDADNLTRAELAYIDKVYNDLITDSLNNLDALTTVLTAKKLRASDDERLKTIDSIYEQMSSKLTIVRHFNSNALLLSAQRENEKNDAGIISDLLDVNP
jgi:hypothetical protein